MSTLECTSASTINEVVKAFPATLAVFSRYGLDTCCGGGLPMADAAVRHGIDPVELLAAVRQVTVAACPAQLSVPDNDAGIA